MEIGKFRQAELKMRQIGSLDLFKIAMLDKLNINVNELLPFILKDEPEMQPLFDEMQNLINYVRGVLSETTTKLQGRLENDIEKL